MMPMGCIFGFRSELLLGVGALVVCCGVGCGRGIMAAARGAPYDKENFLAHLNTTGISCVKSKTLNSANIVCNP